MQHPKSGGQALRARCHDFGYPALIGGVVAQVGSHMYDGSLRSQLAELGRTLINR